MKKVHIKQMYHRGKNNLALHFLPDKELQQLSKNIGCLWSNTHKCWYINNSPQNLKEIFRIYKGKAFINADELFKRKELKQPPPVVETKSIKLPELTDEEKRSKLLKFKYQMCSRRYSENTIEAYIDALKIFFRYFHQKPLHKITNDDVISFNNKYIIARKFSSAYQGQIINAVKLFYSTIQQKELNPEKIERPRKERKLPNVLSKEEVKNILYAHGNLKHKAMLSLIYSCGLRRSELLRLAINDVDSRRNLLVVRQARAGRIGLCRSATGQ